MKINKNIVFDEVLHEKITEKLINFAPNTCIYPFEKYNLKKSIITMIISTRKARQNHNVSHRSTNVLIKFPSFQCL